MEQSVTTAERIDTNCSLRLIMDSEARREALRLGYAFRRSDVDSAANSRLRALPLLIERYNNTEALTDRASRKSEGWTRRLGPQQARQSSLEHRYIHLEFRRDQPWQTTKAIIKSEL